MLKKIQEKLLIYKKRMISISELETMAGRSVDTYETFANNIIKLEMLGYLEMVQTKGRNGRTPSLAYRYRINTSLLKKEHHQEIQQYRLKLKYSSR